MFSKFFKGVRRNVFVLGIVSFFTDVSSEMIFAVLPLFLANVLGVPKTFIGLIEGVAESTASLLKVASGWLSDRFRKRKPFLFAGYFLSTIAKPIFAFARNWFDVVLVRFGDRLGKGLRKPAGDALIAESSAERARGKAFGLHRALDTLGAVVGPLIAFIILGFYAGGGSEAYRTIFLLAAIPAFVGFLLVFFLKETGDGVAAGGKARTRLSAGFYLLKPTTKRFLLVTTLFATANFSYAFFVIRAQDFGVSANWIPLLYLGYNVVYAIAALPFGALSDKLGKKRFMALGYTLFCLTCVGFAFGFSPLHAVLLFIGYGLFNAINESIPTALLTQLEPGKRGTALGVFHALAGLAALPASLIAGVLWEAYGASATFLFAAGTALVALALLLTWKETR